jgi:tetratricopeptide (TPR) repeat protein
MCLAALPMIPVLAAEKAAVENPQVAKQISDAQKLSAKRQWSEALAAIKKAQAIPGKSAYSEYRLNEFLAYLLTQQKKYAEAAAVFEQMVNSKVATPETRFNHLKTAAQLYYLARVYPRAASAARRAITQKPGDLQLLEILRQTEQLGGN